jgi:flagellar motility protein MotE (MotC chaperone)
MLNRTIFLIAVCAACLVSAPTSGRAEDTTAPKKAVDAEAADSDGVARYCANIGPSVAELRLARQMKRMTELEAEIKLRIQQLEQKEAEAREWVNKRQSMLQRASDEIVAIFSKMDPEAAAPRLGMLDDDTAAAVLAKLTPRSASAILNEMEPSRAGRLTSLLSGVAGAAKKS